jgi:AcrR family transcriptional regulator
MAARTVGPVRRSRPAKRDIILAAARLHFINKGYIATSVSDLAQELRCSKSTIWGSFPTKADLLNAVIHDLAIEWSTAFEVAYTAALKAEDDLVAYCDEISRFLDTPDARKALPFLIGMSTRSGNPVSPFQTIAIGTITRHLATLKADPDQLVRLLSGPCLHSLLAPACDPACSVEEIQIS